jgi:hypothetical protein
MKTFIAAMVLATSSSILHATNAFDCNTKRNGEPLFVALPRFTFSIRRAPLPFQPTDFRVCDAVGAAPFLLVKSSRDGKDKVLRIELSDEAHSRLLQLYEGALSSNFNDTEVGLDGSSWCLDAQRGGNSLRVCFWSPQYNTEKRGLSTFRALGEGLWDLAGFGETNGPLM